MATNPRYKNGTLRRKHRARFKAQGLPCHICGKPIRYDEPSDSKHPFSFVIDEVTPISKYWLAGYGSREEAAQDINNLAPAHYICNQLKSNKTNFTLEGMKKSAAIQMQPKQHKNIKLDGKW